LAGVFLVGFMGCGKTTVGLALSHLLGWRFADLDTRISDRQGRSIPEIFRNQGERPFRQIEQSALLELIDEMRSTPTVAALGGGAFVQADNLSLLECSGFPAVFLDAPVTELWRRCCDDAQGRPLARNENQFRQLYESRRGLYMKAAVAIHTDGKDIQTVAAEVASWLKPAGTEESSREV
jgi:shikimate kinase